MRLAERLNQSGRLSKVYSRKNSDGGNFGDLTIIDLKSSRALGAAWKFLRLVGNDPAGTFFLTLGYVNLSPLLRLRRARSRIILRIGSILSAEASYRSRLSRLRYFAATRLACRFADCIIVQGVYMRDDLLEHIPSAKPKVQIIYNPIENELWEHSPSAAAPIACPYIFCAATFKPEKAFDVLLPAYASSSARHVRKLVIAGVAADDKEFTALMEVNGLSEYEVVRLGFIASPYDWIAHADLCVLTSRYEGFSNFLLEAGSLGKLIVATLCPGGNAELFNMYRNVISVPVDDRRALSNSLAAPRNDIPRSDARKRLHVFEPATVHDKYLRALSAQSE